MAAMAIYKVPRKAERFGASFRVCDSKDASVDSCDQFLTELSLRDCSVYTQRAYAIGLAHFFSWLRASGGDPDHVTRQIVANYITEFARGARQGAVSTHSAQKPRQPRTINHRLSVLAFDGWSDDAEAALLGASPGVCVARSVDDLVGMHSERGTRWERSYQPSLRQPPYRGTAPWDDRP